MLPNVKNYFRPREVAEALALLNCPDERRVFVAGGTQLALSNHSGILGLIDLDGLGLRTVRAEGEVLRLGAGARPNDLWRDAIIRKTAGGVLAEAAGNYHTETQRNRATLGGILVAQPGRAELVAALLALDAEVGLVLADGEKAMPLSGFLELGAAKAAKNALLREVRLPLVPARRGAGERLARAATDPAIVSVIVTAVVKGDRLQETRVAVSGLGGAPERWPAAEAACNGVAPAAAAQRAPTALDLKASTDVRASAEFRQEMAVVLLRRALERLGAAS